MANYNNNDSLSIMSYTLKSGITQTIPLSLSQIKLWTESFRIKSNFVVQTGEEIFGLNPLEIASFRIHNKHSENYSVVNPVKRDDVEDVILLQRSLNKDELIDEASVKEKQLYQIECNCGVESLVYLNMLTYKIVCRSCNNLLFRDVERGSVSTIKGEAFILTNRNWVDREKAKQYVNALKSYYEKITR